MRRGHSLIELLAVMTVASVVFTVIGVTLYAMNRMHAQLQRETHTAAALHDFAQQLRDDAHAAAEWKIVGEQAGGQEPPVTLTFPGGRTVMYDASPDSTRLRRREVQDGRTLRRDTFALPQGSQVHWQAPEEESLPRLAVVVARPAGPAQRPTAWRTTRIEASLGMHREMAP
jgi:prepilin-type N-terminal cleavage/methylation domain-containing protein